MGHELKSNTWILWTVLAVMISGCDEQATRIARQAADRQAQQNTAMAELHQEVASGARRLVEADAKARTEIVGVHRDLQAERSRLDTHWNALETERRQIAGQRRTESLLVSLGQIVGGLSLAVVLLGFCWYALVAAGRANDSEGELNEFLVYEVLSDTRPWLDGGPLPPSRLGHAPPAERPAE